MKICTVCQRYYEDSVASCAEDHGSLVPAKAMPETFAAEENVSDAAVSNIASASQTSESSVENFQPTEIAVTAKNAETVMPMPTNRAVAESSAGEFKDGGNDGNDSFRKSQGFSPEQDDLTLFAARRIFEERENTIPVERRPEATAALQESEPVHTQEKRVESFPREAVPFVVKVSSESESFFVKNEEDVNEKDAVETAVLKADDSPVGAVKMRETRQPAPLSGDLYELPRPASPASSSKRLPLLVGAGLLALLASVGLGMFLYNQRQKSPDYERATVEQTPIVSAPEPTTAINNKAAAATETDAADAKQSAPIAVEESAATASESEIQNQPSRKTTAVNEANQPSETAKNQTANENPAAEIESGDNESVETSKTGNEQTELSSSLDEWVTATNARDVERQMDYYAPKVSAYYRTRNVSPELVRAEKNRVFARANAVDIQTGKPEIVVSRDGRSATMRFRKKYAIKEGEKSRNGEVIQELRWVKSGGAWKIVSERDVKVINR